jgi:hypothetical protein
LLNTKMLLEATSYQFQSLDLSLGQLFLVSDQCQ